jgi:hypothetical protein
MTNFEPLATPSAPAIDAAPKAGAVARVIAFVAAICILVVGALFSFGTVLLAAGGMVLAGYVWRRRGRLLSAAGRWVAACCSTIFVLLLVAGVFAVLVPASTWKQVKQATDSASTASGHEPPPAWIERMYPGMSKRAAEAPPLSPSTQTAMMAFGAAFALIFFAAFFGTLAWGGGMLLGLAIKGRWPGTVP